VKAPCDICGREDVLTTAQVVGAPVSVAQCPACLGRQVQPMWVVENVFCIEVDDSDTVRTLTIQETFRRLRGWGFDPFEDGAVAEWFLDADTWTAADGYIKVRDYVKREWDATATSPGPEPEPVQDAESPE
jgi:hypothetical protein